jgi:hypothetical protein
VTVKGRSDVDVPVPGAGEKNPGGLSSPQNRHRANDLDEHFERFAFAMVVNVYGPYFFVHLASRTHQ